MTSPSVSIVLPTRNRSGLLRTALASALAQRDVDIELVPVNDGSTDDTGELLEQLRDSRVTPVHHSTTLGVSSARNAGIRASQGDWIAFLDDDDLLAPSAIATQIAELDASRGALWSCLGAVSVNERLATIDWTPPPAGDAVVELLRRANVVPAGGSGVLAARALLDEVGQFDPELSVLADWDQWIRFARRSRMVPVFRPLVAHRVHSGNMAGSAPRAYGEIERLASNHPGFLDRSARRTGLNFHRLSAISALHSGRRRDSRQAFAGAVGRHRDWRDACGMLAVTFAPDPTRLWHRLRVSRIPRSVLEEAEGWLRLYRE